MKLICLEKRSISPAFIIFLMETFALPFVIHNPFLQTARKLITLSRLQKASASSRPITVHSSFFAVCGHCELRVSGIIIFVRSARRDIIPESTCFAVCFIEYRMVYRRKVKRLQRLHQHLEKSKRSHAFSSYKKNNYQSNY